MWGKTRLWFMLAFMALFSLALVAAPLCAYAQDDQAQQGEEGQEGEEGEEEPAPVPEPQPQLKILGYDVTSPPSIIINTFGRDAEGRAIDFSSAQLSVTHDGTAVIPTASETYPGGTLTVFLLDIPTGVSEQLPAIQDAIRQFASPGGGMQEQIDYVAIYQVGETEARELLPVTNFYNSIQNFLVDGLNPETGSTALLDSLGSLLSRIEGLKPDPDIPVSVVVLSDGTDVVSTETQPEDIVRRAVELNIPIHTVWVNSTDLTLAGQQQGQAYLQSAADETLGQATFLDDSAGLADLWARIAAFRERARVRYVVEGLSGGSYETTLRVGSDPALTASTTIEVPENQPQVSLVLPEGSDSLTVPELEEPITLRLGAAVSWLDGEPRELDTVRLRVNGADVADPAVDQIGDFSVELSNLQFGANTVEVLVTDEQGLRATSLPATITVLQGPRDIPAQLQPGPEWGNIILNIFLVLVVLGVLVGLYYWIRRSRRLPTLIPRGRSRPRAEGVSYTTTGSPGAAYQEVDSYGQPPVQAYLEVLEAVTDMPPILELRGHAVRIGRSPAQCDIAFREDLTVSRQHANLMLEGNHYRLFDEQSTSGTWVNGRQVPEYGVELMDGDEIHLGAVHVLYRQG